MLFYMVLDEATILALLSHSFLKWSGDSSGFALLIHPGYREKLEQSTPA
jgi:hypothetical protein